MICKKCGYERDYLGKFDDYECAICGGELVRKISQPSSLNNTKPEDDVLKGIVEEMSVVKMKENIVEMGNDEIWRMIEENFHNSRTRLAYRKIFFKAGGFAPLRIIK